MALRDLSKIAQEQVHSGDTRHTFTLKIAGKDWTEDVESATITYAADGGSEVTILSHRSMTGWENSPVYVDFGFGGHEMNYFQGILANVDDRHWGAANEAIAWGPFRVMAEQVMLNNQNYSGWGIDDAINNIVQRAGYRAGVVEVQGRGNFTIEADTIFPLESTLLDAASTLCEAAGYIYTDRPRGRLLFKPRPLPGATGKVGHRYSEQHFPAEGFLAVPSTRGHFSRVIVFRRNDEGNGFAVYKDIPVENHSRVKPAKNRAFIIPDFVGSNEAADREGRATARALEQGVYDIQMTGITANPELLLHDTIETRVREIQDDRWYESVYRWVADQGVTVSLSGAGNLMDVTGTGMRVSQKRVARPFYTGRSNQVVRF